MLKSKLLSATAAAPEAIAIEDVFSTYLYLGNGSTQTITNGIDLAGEGGLVWIKSRTAAQDNYLFDTSRGTLNYLRSNRTNAQAVQANSLTSFNVNGFTLGNYSEVNTLYSGIYDYASWTFRKAPRFFDVVTYTGNGVAGRTVPHNLGVAPGCIIIKSTDSSFNWYVYHLSTGNTKALYLNTSDSGITSTLLFNNTSPTSTEFTLGSGTGLNGSGATYVAYLFAHDPLGPSGDGSDGLIACGSYTGNGSTNGPEIDLGWEPQWVIVKRSDSGSSWFLMDTMRGMSVGNGVTGNTYYVNPNNSNAEDVFGNGSIDPTPTGFTADGTNTNINASGGTYIYIAIRRGPMREPTSGTEVFAAFADTTASPRTLTTGWPVDFGIQGYRTLGWDGNTSSRLQGGNYLRTRSTSEEFTGFQYFNWDNNTALVSNDGNTSSKIIWAMRRAPGFFDVVAYTGDGVAGRTVPHNLGVAPEMMIVKWRGGLDSWYVYHSALGPSGGRRLNSDSSLNTPRWDGTSPTASVFTVGTTGTNVSGDNYIAYLFATLPGISKVGSYTGNGSSQTINCSFTGGARFVLIKRTDSTGDWYVWDTARGIVSGNDPHLSLNTTAAEVTSDDTIDPDSSGFIVNQVSATNVNVSSASYIFLAVS